MEQILAGGFYLPIFCAFISGCLIGSVGIGGVILVPLLVYTGGIAIHAGIGGAMFAYLISGAIGTYIYTRHGSIRWEMALWLGLGAMPGAYGGSLLVHLLPDTIIEAGIGVMAAISGWHALRSPDTGSTQKNPGLSFAALFFFGALTGLGSALSGTGGPLILVPLLIWLQFPTIIAIGLAQAIQLPIAALATIGNFHAGALDLWLGLQLGFGISFGALLGARMAHILPRAVLRRIVATVLLGVGVAILTKSIFRF